ncbi:hypothetical protein [Microbacterium sp.]|uniref:hypothetical protein n=1 Tax=Microbacterium sp. TaxID=51671 RepID=UPI002620EBD0|nr:hypothetical protein [Microbacterium sp.]
MNDTKTPEPTTWWHVITRPANRLIITGAVLVVFICGIVLGAVLPEYRFWFYLPALAAILAWYLAMMRIYRAATRDRP